MILNKEQITGFVNYIQDWKLYQWVSITSETWEVNTQVIDTWIIVEENNNNTEVKE